MHREKSTTFKVFYVFIQTKTQYIFVTSKINSNNKKIKVL